MDKCRNSKNGDTLEGKPSTKQAKRNHRPSTRGYRHCKVDPQYSMRKPARMVLGKVNPEEAMRIWKPEDFNTKLPKASLAASDVKEVGSCMKRADSPDDLITPAQVPEYTKPMHSIRLEKEPGEKRPPKEEDAYVEYVEQRFGLCDEASKAGAALAKDIVCERSSLMLLLNFLCGDLSQVLMRKGSHKTPVDLMKITKNGKGIVLERIFEYKNLHAEFRKQDKGWIKWEVSNRGNYSTAFYRACTQGRKAMESFMCTGLKQVAGSRDSGVPDKCSRFVEFDMGGMSFLTKAPAHAKHEGKDVELKHKNWYYQDEVKLIETYWKMLLGKTDMFVLGTHRSGLLIEAVEITVEDIVNRKPAIVGAAENRLGWLVELLKQVKEAVSSDGDGPWVLQWQQGDLLLGKYEKVEAPEGEKPEKVWVPRVRTPAIELPEQTKYERYPTMRPKRNRQKTTAPGVMY